MCPGFAGCLVEVVVIVFGFVIQVTAGFVLVGAETFASVGIGIVVGWEHWTEQFIYIYIYIEREREK